jgi:hypothetical protein
LTPLTLPNRAAQLDYLLTEIQSRSSEESLLPDGRMIGKPSAS